MIEELIKTGALNTPWPVRFSDGTTIGGRLGINSICEKKCVRQDCASDRATVIGTRCHLGLTVYESRFDNVRIQVYGVLGPQHRDFLPTHVDFKHAYKGRQVTAQEFSAWISNIKDVARVISDAHSRSLAEALHPLHDAMRLSRDVEQLAEKVLAETHPDTSDRFAAASENQRALLKTSSLLVDTFDLLEIYLNPKAATYGQPKSLEIYKLLDKLAKIAGLARRQEKRPFVKLIGKTRRAFDLYESFKLIPLALIDNAQKYSRSDVPVLIEIVEVEAGVQVAVTSEGALLHAEEQSIIFNRGVRGAVAQKVHPSGMGLGLHIAQTVALAHGSKIRVESIPLGFEISGNAQARNTFSFLVKDVVRRVVSPSTVRRL